jgi:hypothetical protein
VYDAQTGGTSIAQSVQNDSSSVGSPGYCRRKEVSIPVDAI